MVEANNILSIVCTSELLSHFQHSGNTKCKNHIIVNRRKNKERIQIKIRAIGNNILCNCKPCSLITSAFFLE